MIPNLNIPGQASSNAYGKSGDIRNDGDLALGGIVVNPATAVSMTAVYLALGGVGAYLIWRYMARGK